MIRPAVGLLLAVVLTWAHPTANPALDHFRIYAREDIYSSNETPAALPLPQFIASVSARGPFEWDTAALPAGRWLVSITRWDHEDDRESPRSEEIAVYIRFDAEGIRHTSVKDTVAPQSLEVIVQERPRSAALKQR